MIRCVCLWEMVFYLFIVKEEHMRILSWFLFFMCNGRSTQILVLRFYCFWFHSKSSYFRFFICLKVNLEKKSIFLETMRKIVFLNVKCHHHQLLLWRKDDMSRPWQVSNSVFSFVFVTLFQRFLNIFSWGNKMLKLSFYH